jgi:hypothetical protein
MVATGLEPTGGLYYWVFGFWDQELNKFFGNLFLGTPGNLNWHMKSLFELVEYSQPSLKYSGKLVLRMGKVKVKFTLDQAMKTQKDNVGVANHILSLNSAMDGPGSSVGIATGYRLDGAGIESR